MGDAGVIAVTIAMTPTAVSKIASPTGGPGQELPFEDPSGDDQRQTLEEREPAANVGARHAPAEDADREPGAAALGPQEDGTSPLTPLKIGNPSAPASAGGSPDGKLHILSAESPVAAGQSSSHGQ